MRAFLKYIIAGIALIVCQNVSAQFTIRYGVDTLSKKSVEIENALTKNRTTTRGGYFDPEAYRAEQRRIWHQRNTIEFNATLQTSLQQYENWVAAASNTWSLLAHIDFRHIYKREILSVDYSLVANFGMNYIDKRLFKNRDDVKFSTLVQWKIRNAWSFSGTFTFETQFADGYKSRTDQTLISSFMSPAKIAISPGFTYNPTSFPIIVTISPFGGNITTMIDPVLSPQGLNGVPKGQKAYMKLGPSVNVNLDKSFGKNKTYRYRSTLYLFSNLTSAPLVQWNNTLDIRLTKYISTTATFQLYYDRPSSPKLQYNYSIMLGLAYKFKNK